MQEFFHQQYVLGVVLDFFSRCIDFDHLSITKKHLWAPQQLWQRQMFLEKLYQGKKDDKIWTPKCPEKKDLS